jgi:N-acetylneuraminic acid mutarotase
MLRILAACGLAAAPLPAATTAWTPRPAYPLSPGVAGAIAGAHHGVLIAAGGANFPGKMPWEGGKKVYYDEIFVLTPGDGTWRAAGRLPAPRAYATVVDVPDGVLMLGGENAETVFQDALLLRWNGKAVAIEQGPGLPAPRTSAAAAVLAGSVYLAGGYAPGAVRESCRDFWRLDLADRERGWKTLESWPGPTRGQAVMAAVDGMVYLMSGLEMVVDREGKPKSTYLCDAFRYRGDKWEPLPAMPWSAIAAPTPAPTTAMPARIYVLGGVDGRLVGKVPRDTRVPDHLMYFDVADGGWHTLETPWPDPVVTAPAVRLGDEWWIVSGEIMAGVRTTSIWSLRPEGLR